MQIRGFGKNPQGEGTLHLDSYGNAKITLAKPAWAPASGQPAVIYKGKTLLGGGYLESASNNDS